MSCFLKASFADPFVVVSQLGPDQVPDTTYDQTVNATNAAAVEGQEPCTGLKLGTGVKEALIRPSRSTWRPFLGPGGAFFLSFWHAHSKKTLTFQSQRERQTATVARAWHVGHRPNVTSDGLGRASLGRGGTSARPCSPLVLVFGHFCGFFLSLPLSFLSQSLLFLPPLLAHLAALAPCLALLSLGESLLARLTRLALAGNPGRAATCRWRARTLARFKRM